jgi:hypothetical protein
MYSSARPSGMYSVHTWNCVPIIDLRTSSGQSDGTGSNPATSSIRTGPPIATGSASARSW